MYEPNTRFPCMAPDNKKPRYNAGFIASRMSLNHRPVVTSIELPSSNVT